MWYICNIKSEIYHIKGVHLDGYQTMVRLIGLLSLLGFVGVFTGERYFLGFFAFAVDFQYFFTRADEMQRDRFSARPHGAFSRAWE